MSTNAVPEMIARADHDTAVAAARKAGVAEGLSLGEASGFAAGESTGKAEAVGRIRAILTCEQAKGREPQALVFALDSDMTAEVAAKALAASPAGKAAVPPLDARTNPPVPGSEPPNPSVDNRASWDRSLKKAGANLPT